MNLQIRQALESDRTPIFDVVMASFGSTEGKEIADLINDLLMDPSAQPLWSFIATVDDKLVGHILFTSTHVGQSRQTVSSAILAPLAVHPDYQNQGIGGQLIIQGLRRLKDEGVDLVFVLGHPTYYPKYGFSAAGIKGFEAPYPILPENAEAWMVQELRPGIVEHVSGLVICADALNDPKYWQE